MKMHTCASYTIQRVILRVTFPTLMSFLRLRNRQNYQVKYYQFKYRHKMQAIIKCNAIQWRPTKLIQIRFVEFYLSYQKRIGTFSHQIRTHRKSKVHKIYSVQNSTSLSNSYLNSHKKGVGTWAFSQIKTHPKRKIKFMYIIVYREKFYKFRKFHTAEIRTGVTLPYYKVENVTLKLNWNWYLFENSWGCIITSSNYCVTNRLEPQPPPILQPKPDEHDLKNELNIAIIYVLNCMYHFISLLKKCIRYYKRTGYL